MSDNLGYENLKELDNLEIIVIVDEDETLDFTEYCCGAHGYSILITGTCGVESHSVLFDAGQYGQIFIENSNKLGVDYSKIETVVLSHWHCDHSDGLPSAIEAISEARRGHSSKVIIDLPKERPSRRGIRLPKSDNVMVINNPTFEELEKAGGEIVKSSEPHTICSNFFYVSGRISRQTTYETGIVNHVAYDEKLSTWKDDPLINEERFLTARIKNKGLIVFTGCSHAGIVNTLLQAQNPLSNKQEEKYPIYLVMGGFHLAGYDQESKIKETVRDLKALINPVYLAPGHCSGWRCSAALEYQLHEGEAAFAGRVAPSAVGKIYTISYK
ncbi:11200_t:CDS:2 [Funneliformis geosporum]|nr:11200_t:CDS:2 [Funneliformis geosporum]